MEGESVSVLWWERRCICAGAQERNKGEEKQKGRQDEAPAPKPIPPPPTPKNQPIRTVHTGCHAFHEKTTSTQNILYAKISNKSLNTEGAYALEQGNVSVLGTKIEFNLWKVLLTRFMSYYDQFLLPKHHCTLLNGTINIQTKLLALIRRITN